jgi:hypothetical protein
MENNIKTFEDACAALGLDPNALPDFSMIPEKERGPLLAHYKLTVIARALNGDWQPDWSNGQWDKYYPWFEMERRGVGFAYDACDHWYTISYVGSRLCYKSAELARYAGETFIELYKEYFVIQK